MRPDEECRLCVEAEWSVAPAVTPPTRRTVTDTDTVVLAALDFQPPCQVTYQNRERKCKEPAEWIVWRRPHCGPSDDIKERFFCDSHYEYMVRGDVWWCHKCDTANVLRDYIVRTERLCA